MARKISLERGLYLIDRIKEETVIVCFYNSDFSDYLLNNVKMNKKDLLKNFESLKKNDSILKIEHQPCHLAIYIKNGFFLVQY